jgi:hypothetical protein
METLHLSDKTKTNLLVFIHNPLKDVVVCNICKACSLAILLIVIIGITDPLRTKKVGVAKGFMEAGENVRMMQKTLPRVNVNENFILFVSQVREWRPGTDSLKSCRACSPM